MHFLCTLKGSETKTCSISNDGVAIFAVFSKATRNYKYDMRSIPAGDEPVFLRGRSVCDYWSGMMFRFDGETSPKVEEDARRFATNMVIVCVVTFIVSFALVFLLRFLA